MKAGMSSGRLIKFLVYLVVVVLINVAGMTLFFRWDITGGKVYSISKASREAVATLSEPLTVKVFFSKNLPAPHNTTERYLRDLLEEYAIYANRYFNYSFHDVSAEEGDIPKKSKENQELARNYGIHPVQVQVIEKDEVKFQKAYMGLVMIHGDLIERIPTITSTEGLEYTITTAIRKLNNKVSALLGLTDKIRVKLILSSSLDNVAPFINLQGLKKLPGEVERLVEKLNRQHYGKLAFEYVDPKEDQALEEVLQNYNVLSLKWPALSGGQVPPGRGVAGLVLEHGKEKVGIPIIRVLRLPIIGTRYELADVARLEEVVNENIETLIAINDDLGYLADHGTLRASFLPPGAPEEARDEALGTFRQLVSQGYTFKEVRLKDGLLPDSFNTLVIARPTEPFTEEALFQIDQFLMRGKSLALFLDALHEVASPGQEGMFGRGQPGAHVPLNTGLEKLLDHYGIRMRHSYVLDENCFKQRLPAQLGGGERAIYFAPIIKQEFIDGETPFMKGIKGLVAIKASPLEVQPEKIATNGLKARRLFSSSERSWEMSGRISLNPMMMRPPQDPGKMKSYPLAYVVEGPFPSYFAGKPIPAPKAPKADTEPKAEGRTEDKGKSASAEEKKPDADLSKIERSGEVLTKGKPGRIFLMASADMLKDNILDERGRTPNSMFVLNLLDYLNGREDIAVMRSKELSFNPLRNTEAGVRTFVKSFNIAGLPILVVLFGLLVWFLRHSRKKRIRMMFQK
jgi:ABC-type uncharacterized transport system involved in gliding motility auxiliary subunit